jgi:large subunit ribosomal protein L1
MSKITKRNKLNSAAFEPHKPYGIAEAVKVLKGSAATKFDQSVDIQLQLGADPTASDQVIRGTTTLPHGTGKTIRVVVLTRDEAGTAAKEAGADEVGGDDLIEKIQKGWMEFDVVVASPSMMKDLAKLGRVLGPRGLMPSPKAGTVTDDLAKAVKEIKKGRIEFKMDKQRNLHASIGRLSFNDDQLIENAKVFMSSIVSMKPRSLKGEFVRKAHVSSTMGPGALLDLGALVKQGASDE